MKTTHRYCPQKALPHYRYIPGKGPKDEKRKDLPKFKLIQLSEKSWKENEAYLYGIDLLNAGFYYEAHEVWEELWHFTGHTSTEGKFLKALIQLSAIQLKLTLQEKSPAERLLKSAHKILLDISKLEKVLQYPDYMGIPFEALLNSLNEGHAPEKITLQSSG